MVYGIFKRTGDIVFAAAALVLSLPFWIWAMLAILLTDGWPFLYPQTRVGRKGRVFRIYKFRSMIRDAERGVGAVFSQRDDPRVTRVGRIMRKSAIDEIPQLLNILRGDMSWVGPRAARPEEVTQYLQQIPSYHMRHQVRPGLTGLAQVWGSDYDDIREKLAYDLRYVRERSLWVDIELYVRSWANTLLARWDAARRRGQ